MQKAKGLIASGIWLFIIGLGPPLQGATFDEQLAAPRATSAQSLQSQLQAHFDSFRQKQQEPDPAAFIRDEAAHKRWTDLRFALVRAMEEGLPLDDLSAFGLIVNPDKSHTVDLQKFPEWKPLDAQLNLLSNADMLESLIPALQARGFRDSDADILRNYVATHDSRVATYTEGRPLVNSFAKRLQAQRTARRALDLNEVMRFRYQKNNVRSEAERQWALGLFDALDAQCQRILASYLEEIQSQLMFGAASEPLEQVLENEAKPLVSGEYVQLLELGETQIRNEMQQRSRKLIRGEQQ